jgi:uncharacterized membrane protein YhaH (DUF805 family)
MFDFLFNPQGRVSRKGYALGYLLPYILLVVLPPLILSGFGMIGLYTTVIGLFFLWPSLIAVPFKRFHDLGLTGWIHVGVLVLIGILTGFALSEFFMEVMRNPALAEELDQGVANDPISGFAAMWAQIDDPAKRGALIAATVLQYGEPLAFLVLPGERRANRFGEDPTVSGRGFAD